MVQATFTISASDFTDEIIEKIKSYLQGQRAFVTIKVEMEPSESIRKQTREAYFAQLDEAVSDIRAGKNLVAFSMEEFQGFAQTNN